jgi:translation initiation factor 2B subunit (eIF-2B alpha/beta/delta family)
MAAIIELAEELDNLVGPVCEQAQEHIHNDECVLVYGHSPLLEAFLKAAARKRRFQGNPCTPSSTYPLFELLSFSLLFGWAVVIAEGGPSLDGHKLAASLPKVC